MEFPNEYEYMTFDVVTQGTGERDNEVETFEDYSDAVDYANERADELEEQGYETDRGWASQDNLFAVKATKGKREAFIVILKGRE